MTYTQSIMERIQQRIQARKNERGFGLLELVITVGVILITTITVGGIYNAVSDSTDKGALGVIVQTAYNDAIAADFSFDEEPEDAIAAVEAKWNADPMLSARGITITMTKNYLYAGYVCVIAESPRGNTAYSGYCSAP